MRSSAELINLFESQFEFFGKVGQCDGGYESAIWLASFRHGNNC